MIDLHAHILPGVDDGSYSLEESLRMARLAVESGVRAMTATPHCNLPEDSAPLNAKEVQTRVRQLQQELDREKIPLRLYPGMEIFGTPETTERLRSGWLMPLAGSRYPLVEFPFHDYGHEATELLEEILGLGLRPIVAHPERYYYTQMDPGLLNIWVDMGCLLQVNRGSLMGRFGPREEALGHALVERGFAAFAASDAHRSDVRTPWMQDVQTMLSEEYCPEAAELLLSENPRRVLADQEIEMEEPDWF